MPNSRWQQAKELFNQALGRPAEEQSAFLTEVCGSDEDLRQEVESLLNAYRAADQFIETPVVDDALKVVDSNRFELPAGRRIGQYEIIRKLGDGGMGAVYLAGRADAQFEKQVAIKIIKFGFENEFIVNRFLSERQILANLDHPNIARLLDGGTTETGSPYLVMEYVEGRPIDEYCNQQQTTIPERLKLFRAACAAVHYAHSNLIIHRDIKPGNILVTTDGVPKLLDFGIAKLLTIDSGTPGRNQTATAIRLMTPDYASPEQVRGGNVTTATDVYSLGVVLYQLLTGHQPYQLKSHSAEEMIRAVCETEPVKPSAVVVAVSPRPRLPVSGLKGDLDNVVLMALRKEPERRYESVAQFSADIQRHLDGLPVIARPDTFKYRATKFVQRNRISVAAAAVIVLSLIAGVIATAWQARAAARQARVAQQEKARAESINTVLERLLNYSNPVTSASQSKGHPTTMQEALDEAARRIDSGEFDNQPEVKAELERIIGISYNFQGQYELAIKHLATYVNTQRTLSAADDPKMLDASAIWAALLAFKGQQAEAEQTYRRILPLMRLEYNRGRIKPEVMANTLNLFGYVRRNQGDSREAEALFRETISLSPMIPNESRYLVRLTRSTLASTLADQGKFDEALQTARDAAAEFRQNGQTDLPDFGFALTVLGGFLIEQGDFANADAALQDGENLFRKLLRPTHLWLGDNLRNQALSFYRQGKFADAETKVIETLKIYRESYGVHYDNYPTALIIQGLTLNKTGNTAAAETTLREALKLRTESLPADHFWTAMAKGALGEFLLTSNRYAESEPLLLDSYRTLKAKLGAKDPRTNEARTRIVKLYELWHKPEMAAPYESQNRER